MRYELRELQNGFEILPALAKSDKKKPLVDLWLGYPTVIVDTFTEKRTYK
jgi:hypothetical protein